MQCAFVVAPSIVVSFLLLIDVWGRRAATIIWTTTTTAAAAAKIHMQYNCIELHNMSRLYILLNRRCFSFIVSSSLYGNNIVRTYCLRSMHFIACANNIMRWSSSFRHSIKISYIFSALLVRYFLFWFLHHHHHHHHITLPRIWENYKFFVFFCWLVVGR